MVEDQQHIDSEKARSGAISGRVRNVLFVSFALAVVTLAVITSYFVS